MSLRAESRHAVCVLSAFSAYRRMLLSPCSCVPKAGREHEMDSVMEKIIINADDDNDDTSESTISCDDNDDTQGAVPIVSDSE